MCCLRITLTDSFIPLQGANEQFWASQIYHRLGICEVTWTSSRAVASVAQQPLTQLQDAITYAALRKVNFSQSMPSSFIYATILHSVR